jgi:hypothetical protein
LLCSGGGIGPGSFTRGNGNAHRRLHHRRVHLLDDPRFLRAALGPHLLEFFGADFVEPPVCSFSTTTPGSIWSTTPSTTIHCRSLPSKIFGPRCRSA